MPKIAMVGLLAGVALALSPAAALADPDDGGEGGGRAYPCANGQFWYPQYDQCVVMCKPGFDHISGPEACDKIPTAYRDSYRSDKGWRSPVQA